MARLRLGLALVSTCVSFLSVAAQGTYIDESILDACEGYSASNVTSEGATLNATLSLIGEGCGVFGDDIPKLSLQVTYETETRIHVKITDADNERYEVPESVVPRPTPSGNVTIEDAAIQFNFTENPFSFTIYRTSTEEVLFSTAQHALVYEPQYLRVKTDLPAEANIYGLGEHTNDFHLPTDNMTMTLWSRDAYGVPEAQNLYGNHPVYYEHRSTGTHGVFLLNSNGMDIKLNTTNGVSSLEYNVVGGILDFYFLAGSEEDPREVSKQYAEVVGLPAGVPYWSFGLHQCRFNYIDYVDVAGVISNYSAAGIPLETMWIDIDYMDRRRIFTVDPEYFPMDRVREIVSYLHDHDQKFVVMTDPAVAYTPDEDYGPYHRGVEQDVWLKSANGSDMLGLVWPGVTVYPDWFHPGIQDYWTGEFDLFYNPEDGLDVDGMWIDMNEPANFCVPPCADIFAQAVEQALPPARTIDPPAPDVPIFGNDNSSSTLSKRDGVLDPQYRIANYAETGNMSSHTTATDAVHANGLIEYDVHNLYGSMMSTATRKALLARRPTVKPLIITRSTFAGAGKDVGKWLGDNNSLWNDYRRSISGVLAMASVYGIPMVGVDVCGFTSNTTETLCARWAMLGAFYSFMRNHNGDTSIPQEFYRWESVTEAAKYALDMRYRLLDYLYTAFQQATEDGTPVLQPLWMQYPKDNETYDVSLQFFFGESILVSPVTEENSTSVTAYIPDDNFYNFGNGTYALLDAAGQSVDWDDISFTQIPVHIKGGSVIPLRTESAMTTKEVRQKDFEFVVAPSRNGTASGRLYIDDGELLEPEGSIDIQFQFNNGTLTVDGEFGWDAGVSVSNVKFLGVGAAPNKVSDGEGTEYEFDFDSENLVLDVGVEFELTAGFVLSYE